jgi:hypothetical protein
MARIRQIKPEFWSSPSTASASAVARLLFIAMWNWADDSGHGTANMKELEGFAFPHDDVFELSGGKCRNFRHCVAEVSAAFGVVFYNVRGRMYYEIPSWQNHQRNERLAKGKFPLPAEGEIVDITRDLDPNGGNSRKVSEVPTHNHGSSAPVSEEQRVIVSEGHSSLELRNYVTSEKNEIELARDPKFGTLRIINDWQESSPKPIPGKVVSDAKAQIAPMLQQGIDPADIRAGLAEWWDGKYPASTLPNYVARAGRPQQPRRATGTTRAQDILNIDTSELSEPDHVIDF